MDLIDILIQLRNLISSLLEPINWTALEAVAVSSSALLIYSQVRQYRREATENKIRGLLTALEILRHPEVTRLLSSAREGAIQQGTSSWRSFLEQMEIVGLLVERGYTDIDLLRSIRGEDLKLLREYTVENLPEEVRLVATKEFAKAIQLLDKF